MSFSGIRKTHAGSEPRLSPSNLTQSSIVYPELTLALATRSTDAVISELQRGHASSHNLPVREDNEGKIKKHQILEIGALEELEDTECEEDSEPAASKPQKLTERKRIQRAKFDSYIEGYLKIQASNSAIVLDDDRTTEWLVRQAESEHIIASPRDYQVELFEKAKEKNLIAVLDTGSGKTLIAVLLLRYIIDQELENRFQGKPKRIAFFLVVSVTLVFQQYAVLESNLNQKMNRFCGSMGCDLWSKSTWARHFNENMVIVCTADVLYQCLHHSFISIDRINLLIFDEAHHAKKNHAYARIIKDFYLAEGDKSKRPRLFGMTASPVDARIDPAKAAKELETLLHCQIATAKDTSLLQYGTNSKEEKITTYLPLREPYETPLYQQLKLRFAKMAIFSKALAFAKLATSELGPWCADQLWTFCLSEEEDRKLESKMERKFRARKVAEPIEVLDAQLAQLQEAQELVKSHKFRDPEPNLKDLSSKVVKLMECLRERYERPSSDKCIVFVKQRYTARLLTELFSHPNIGTPNLHVGSLVGTSSSGVGDLNISFRQQVIAMTKFRKGTLNCLFATSVAEEGLDIPECNLVIRFDLYATLIQYIQSRGRARQPNSQYIHMVEHENRIHSEIIKQVYKGEKIMRRFCESLPEDRLLTGNDYDIEYLLSQEKKVRHYTDPASGAKLTYRLSLMVLSNFVGSLPQNSDCGLKAEYVLTGLGKQFLCEVILPSNSPIHGAIGRPASTKQIAKCSAAFEACLLLRQKNFLDEHFLSTFVKELPAMRNAVLAVSSKSQEQYNMRTKPILWAAANVPTELYLTVLTLANPSSLGRPSQPLGILTRGLLPQLPQFPLFFGKDRTSLVQMLPLSTALLVDTHRLNSVNMFTLRIFDDVFSKEYESDVSKMPYFLVPLKDTLEITRNHQPAEIICWDVIAEVEEHEWLPWDEKTPDAFFEDRYVVDPFDGSRKLWAVKVTHNYRPLDPVPANCAPRIGTRKNNDNILEYSCSLWAKARARRTFKEDQPVIEAEFIPLRRNLLDDSSQDESQAPRRCFVVPEPLKISTLPTKVVAMAYAFPAIIHRLESYLIALEACNLLHLNIRPDLALEALTKDCENSNEHNEELIEFKAGMGKNYERLEFLGDCFLKMATTIALYTQLPNSDEYEYHVKRMLMICNQNLLNNALNLKIYERAWYPEGLVLKRGKTATAPTSHRLGNKTIADVCEALIGASLLSFHGTNNVDNAVRAVTELVCSADHVIHRYSDYYTLYTKPTYQTSATTASQRDLAVQVEKIHSYHFRHPRLLRSAFIHPSYPFLYEHVPNYQRLEFLGDSLLDMACINYLYHQFPDRNPQWLTEHKMAMVSNRFLGALCVELGFHKHLLQMNGLVVKNITEYVTEITEARIQAEEEAISAGKSREECSRDFWDSTKSPPKCLPDMVEAYVGAIFVDSEYNYLEVERFFEEHIKWYFEDISIYDTFANKQPVTLLQNFMAQNMGCTNFAFPLSQIPDVGDGMPHQVVVGFMIHNEIVVDKQGESGRYAKVAVARLALEALVGLSLTQFRATYGCDCKDFRGEGM